MAITSVHTLTPVSWDGHVLNDSSYGTRFSGRPVSSNLDSGSNPHGQSITAARPGSYPTFVRGQVQDRMIYMSIKLKTNTLAARRSLQAWFDSNPLTTSQAKRLIATDSNGGSLYIDAYVESFVPRTELGVDYAVGLRAFTPWIAVAGSGGTVNITGHAQTWLIPNIGNTKVSPLLTLTPYLNKAVGPDQRWMTYLNVANKSEQPISDPVGEGFPFLVDIVDTTTLVAGGYMAAGFPDMRVYNAGREINRWTYPVSPTTSPTTKVWSNLQFRAGKIATLAATISSGSPTNSQQLAVSNAGGLAGWPQSGFFIIDYEVFQYSSRTDTYFVLAPAPYAARGSHAMAAAAHTIGASIYWMEHPYLYLIYGATLAQPTPPDDLKPVIDLATSDNNVFAYTNTYINNNDRRSGAWQPMKTDDGPTSAFIRLAQAPPYLYFDDGEPNLGQPNFNNIYFDSPYGISGANALSVLKSVDNNQIRMNIHLMDASGHESLVQSINPGAAGYVLTTPLNPAYRARLNARNSILAGASMVDPGAAQSRTLLNYPATNLLSSQSFICDKDGALVTGVVANVAKAANDAQSLFLGVFNDLNGVPGQLMTVSATFFGFTYAAVFLPHIFNFTYWPALQAGQRYHLVICESSAVLSQAYVRSNGLRDKPRTYFVHQGNTVPGDTGQMWVLTDHQTDAPADAPVKTGDSFYIGNMSMTFDAAKVPFLYAAGVIAMYLLNATIVNLTTGDSITLYWPIQFGNSISIDCENKRVIDNQTGMDIPFACTSTNPDEWLPLVPGNNTMYWIEGYVTGMTVDWSFYAQYLTG